MTLRLRQGSIISKYLRNLYISETRNLIHFIQEYSWVADLLFTPRAQRS